MLILILFLVSIGTFPSNGQQECSNPIIEVYDTNLKRCRVDCGKGKLFDIQLEICQSESQQTILLDCKDGEEKVLQNKEVRCISIDTEDNCCLKVASVDDFDIRMVNAEQGCNCTRRCGDLGKNYECVPTYLCDNGKINTDGRNLIIIYNTQDQCYRNVGNIDLADKTCPDHLTCCKKAKEERKKCSGDLDLPDFSVCGRGSTLKDSSYSPIDPRLIDSQNHGKELEDYAAQIGEFPHMCLFYRRNNGNGEFAVFSGGASLIGRNILLTTATKLYYEKTDEIFDIRNESLGVRCGVLNRKNNDANLPDPQERFVTKVVIHPEYDPRLLKHNIAILIVGDSFKFADHISPVCLPSPTDSFTGKRECYSSGWGSPVYSDSPVYSEFLKKVKLPVIDSRSCQNTIQQKVKEVAKKNFTVYDDWMCVGGEGIADTCRGDGGSPHVCNINNKWVQVGAVAFGFSCGKVGIPSIYSGVAPEMCWIDWVMSCLEGMPKFIELASADLFKIRTATDSDCRNTINVESVNNLRRRDCKEWLRARPNLSCQCEVNYRVR